MAPTAEDRRGDHIFKGPIRLALRLMISQRTEVALAAAKARGRVLWANGRVLTDRNKAEAGERLAPIADRLRAFQAEGLTLRRIAEALNADGVFTLGGAS